MSLAVPTVSVIMPCYNQGQYIEEAIASVQTQTYPNLELIIINDGSTDEGTVDVLHGINPPNSTILHTANRGPAAARNTGIQQAKGEYILPLDADDRIAPTLLERTVPLLNNNPNLGIVYTGAELFGDKTGRFDLPAYHFPDILLGNMIFNTSLYRKADWEKVGGYNPNMVWGWEDYDFWLSLIELGRDVVQIPEVLYFHREVPNSRSQQMTQDYWVKSYTQICKNHPTLYADHMDVIFRHIQELRDDVHRTHTRLGETIAQLNTIVDTVQRSYFWKARKLWVRLQNQLGRSIDPGNERLN